MHRQPAYQEFLHCSGIYLFQAVYVADIFEHTVHYDDFSAIFRSDTFTPGHFPAIAIDTEHIAHKSSYKIVLQRHVALADYIVTLPHPYAPVFYKIIPLIAIREIFATLPFPAEILKKIPAFFRTRKQSEVCP